jgi:glycosyltransferase involved in cell wall biosynthesis
MRGAQALVLPSYTEGLPRVIVEALAVGTPVIASAVGGIPEVIEEGVTGFLVPAGAEPALADRLRRMLGNAEEARRMRHRARRVGKQLFSTEAYVAGYASMFEHTVRM